MNFEWDETKNQRNLEKHGIPFEYAIRVFLDPTRLDTVDQRKNYGEERKTTLGKIEGRLFVVVYTDRNQNRRIISARKANSREMKTYENIYT